MTIVTIHFDKDKADFSKLLKVWEYTAKKHHPNATVKILTVPAPEKKYRDCDQFMSYPSSYAFIKLAEWAASQVHDDVLLTDADVFFLGNCEDVFRAMNDVAITVRPARCWLNAGVLFKKKGNEGVLREIAFRTKAIAEAPQHYARELNEYLGADQAAIAEYDKRYQLDRLLCSEFNLEQNTWKWFSPKTKIVHMKSSLWDLVQGQTPRIGATEENHIYEIYDIWKRYYKEACK